MNKVFFFVMVIIITGNYAFSQCTCTTGCSSLTVITMPFTKDGVAQPNWCVAFQMTVQ